MPVFKRKMHDSLTGLRGREAFVSSASKLLDAARGAELSAVYMRLLNLGAYNVRHGVAAGDEVVKELAGWLVQRLGKQRVGRLSSGAFVAVAPTDDVEPLMDELNHRLPTSEEVNGLALKAGYCVVRDGLDIHEAMERAHYAFDDIRYDCPAWSRLFDRGLETAFERRAYVVDHLDDAIARGEIRAFAQPIIRVLTGLICEVEILARWESEEFGFLRPDEFIPELERHSLIHRLDAEVIRLACKQWSEAAAMGINVPFGINLSRLDFELTDIFGVVTDAMATYGVPVDNVHIEVTESALSRSNDLLVEGIERFRRAGFTLYLDDFGTGYSSLRVLQGTGFDVVKLDMSLLQEVEVNERARVIVADAVGMVKRLAMQSLCEGVETEDQFLFLKAVGCEKAQGYFFSRPLSHEQIMAHLLETAEQHERPEDTRYFDSIGRVNLVDGTRSSVQGVEAAHFMGNQPFAIVEICGQRIQFLSANDAFHRFVRKWKGNTLDGIVERLNADLSDVRNKGLYAASKAISTGKPQQFDFIASGNFCTLGVTHLESSEGRDAFLTEVLSVARYSQFNDFRLLEQSLRFLYTIFKRIDLLDMTENTWHNIYLNVPRYNALRAGATPQDEIDAFCETFIHPDDRDGFLSFYDLGTVDERIRESGGNHVSDVFFALSDDERYEDQLFMLIPLSIDGHRQYLSCMKDLDLESLARGRATGIDRITDGVLLTGILEVTDRMIFWKDEHGRYLGANQQFIDYYGYASVEEILGKTAGELGFDKLNRGFSEDERRVLDGVRVRNVAGVTVRHGELRMIDVSKMPLQRDGRIIGLVGFFRDLGPCEDACEAQA